MQLQIFSVYIYLFKPCRKMITVLMIWLQRVFCFKTNYLQNRLPECLATRRKSRNRRCVIFITNEYTYKNEDSNIEYEVIILFFSKNGACVEPFNNFPEHYFYIHIFLSRVLFFLHRKAYARSCNPGHLTFHLSQTGNSDLILKPPVIIYCTWVKTMFVYRGIKL